MTTAIYLRISRDLAGEGLGVARQLKDCKAKAHTLGLSDLAVYEDNDTSAYSGKTRAQYERMLSDIEAGKVTAVVAWHPDRLHRQSKELERYIEKAGAIPTYTVNGGTLDLSTPAGRAVAKTVGAWAQYESEQKALRLLAKHAELRGSGAMVGARSFGWAVTDDGKLSNDLDPVQAELVAEVAHRILAGESPYHLAAEMNERGFTTTKGGPWTHGNLRLMLLNPKVAGFRAHKRTIYRDEDGKPVMGQWQPIIDPETWVNLVAVLNRKKRTREGSTRHLLGGLINCECGGVMYGSHVRATGLKNYTCRACRTAISHDNLHPVVFRALAASILVGPREDSESAGTDTALVARIESLRKAQKNLLNLVEADVFSLADVASKKAALDKDIAEAEAALGSQAAHDAAGNAVEALRRELWSMCLPDDAERTFFDESADIKAKVIGLLEDMDYDRVRTLVENSLYVSVKRVGKGQRVPDRVKVRHLVATSLNEDTEDVA